MSTRSITHIHEMKSMEFAKERIVCSFYRHCDGYPTGHGDDLANWLKGKSLVNGISDGFNPNTMFNRAGTMAVKLMNHIQDISGCEVIPTGASNRGEEFTYDIYFRDYKFYIQVDDGRGTILKEANLFDGEKIWELLRDEE